MAEGLLMFVRLDDPREVRLETVGRPICPDDEVRLVDEDGRRRARTARWASCCCRGPYTLRGYFGAPEHNARAFTPDGFYRSGDLMRRHPSGNYVVEGRKKDLINRGGEKISAEEIENLILAHPAVQNVACVPMPDPMLGERMCACVVPHDGAAAPSLDELVAFLRGTGDRQVQAARAPRGARRLPALALRQGLQEGPRRPLLARSCDDRSGAAPHLRAQPVAPRRRRRPRPRRRQRAGHAVHLRRLPAAGRGRVPRGPRDDLDRAAGRGGRHRALHARRRTPDGPLRHPGGRPAARVRLRGEPRRARPVRAVRSRVRRHLRDHGRVRRRPDTAALRPGDRRDVRPQARPRARHRDGRGRGRHGAPATGRRRADRRRRLAGGLYRPGCRAARDRRAGAPLPDPGTGAPERVGGRCRRA